VGRETGEIKTEGNRERALDDGNFQFLLFFPDALK